MRNILAALALTGAVTLGGCAGTLPVLQDPTVQNTITNIQSLTASVCGFLPAAETVAGILSTNPVVGTAEAIAETICGVVTKKGAQRGGATPSVNGVPVKGHFVR